MNVHTLLSKQPANEPKSYEIVTCPACAQFHFINKVADKPIPAHNGQSLDVALLDGPNNLFALLSYGNPS
jgi:hypothetical protein